MHESIRQINDVNCTISILITGRVQGVWFRASAKNEADRLVIVGYTKNLSDGRVFIEATGSPVNIDAFKEWCSKGPDLARVDDVEVRQIAQTHSAGFEVRRN